MSEIYPGTNVPFESYALPDLHDPIVLGPGSDSLQTTSQVYSSLAETLDKAVGDLRAVLVKSQHAQQGQAADAARQHVLKVVSAGEVGAEHARLATYALQEQAAYFARARTDMQAAADAAATPVPDLPPAGKGGVSPPNPQVGVVAEQAHTVAVEGAHLYQNNSNHNLTYIFQGFDPPQIAAPDVSVGAQPQAPGWGGGSLGSGAHAVTPAGAAGGTGASTTGAGPGGLASVVPPSGGAGGSVTVPPNVDAPSASGSTLLPAPAGTGGRSGGAATPGGSTVKPGSAIPTPSAAAPSLPGGTPAGRTPPSAPRVGGPLPATRLTPNPTDAEAGRSGWVPGQPWTSRPGTSFPGSSLPGAGSGDLAGRSAAGAPEPKAGGVTEPRSVSGRPSTPGTGEPSPSATGSSSRTTNGHTPLMPMGGAGGRGQDTEHRRPSWLVEDDPEALWMSGLPPHGPAVIEPLED